MCVCPALHTAPSRTHVVFVQHPREARMPVSTCRLAHLSLPNSEMHVAMRPDAVPRLAELLAEPGAMVLFPGPGATDITELTEPPRTLVVVDGSWINAKKIVARSPLLSSLPRLGFTPTKPSNYRIRKEPAFHCLSTIEAVAYVLDILEDAPGRYAPILGSFTRMVDMQLAHVAARGDGPGTRPGGRHAPRVSAADRLRALGDRLVLLFAEAGGDDTDALLQWVAVRPATGARFESLLRPERPLGPYAPDDIDLDAAAVAPEPQADAVARWARFARPDDVIGTWGRHPIDVLAAQGIAMHDPLDLKRVISNLLHAPLGGVEVLAERHGAALPGGRGRPLRKLVALEAVIHALFAGSLRAG